LKNISIITSALIVSTLFTACAIKSDSVESPVIANYLKSKNQDGNQSVVSNVNDNSIYSYVTNKKSGDSMLLKPSSNVTETQHFNVRVGDTAAVIFSRLSSIDKKIYVLGDTDGFIAGFDTNGFRNMGDLSTFISANSYEIKTDEIAGSKYVKISLEKQKNDTEKKLAKIPVGITGMVSASEAIDSIAQSAGIAVEYQDKSAGDVGSAYRFVSFRGNGLDAIKQLANKAGINAEINSKSITLSYFQSEAMDIDIFMRDRSMMSMINNTPNKQPNGSSSGSMSSSSGSQQPTSSSSTGGAIAQDLKVAYGTELIKELRGGIESSLSKYGSYSFLPTTGQVVVRDKGENIRVVQKLISDFNTKFKDTIDGRITFYKVTMDKSDKRGIDLKSLIGDHFSLASTGMVASAFPSVGSSLGNFALGFTDSKTTGLLQFLKELGSTDVINSIDFETQSNSVKTIKVANNYGYISSVTSNAVAGATGTTTSGGITPSSVPDGTFASVIAKNIGNNTVALDIYATANSLSKFNNTEAFGTSVQTPDTSEQSVDGYHQVKAGIPYVLLAYKYNETKHTQQGLPVGWDWMTKIGMNADSGKDVFIIVALEATVK